MLGIQLSEVRKNSLLEFMIKKLGYSTTQLNPEALTTLNQFTMPPGLADKLPDNIISAPPPCATFSPCDILPTTP